jgi:hypothetical protein
MDQEEPLELEDFPSKVKIIEEKLGNAKEEERYHVESKISNKRPNVVYEKNQMLSSDNSIEKIFRGYIQKSN